MKTKKGIHIIRHLLPAPEPPAEEEGCEPAASFGPRLVQIGSQQVWLSPALIFVDPGQVKA